jgi:hypothetical protein
MTLQEEKEIFESLLTRTTNEYLLNDINTFIEMINEEISGGVTPNGDRPSADMFKNQLELLNQLS